jgi:hypothetical protein
MIHVVAPLSIKYLSCEPCLKAYSGRALDERLESAPACAMDAPHAGIVAEARAANQAKSPFYLKGVKLKLLFFSRISPSFAGSEALPGIF